MPPIYSKLEQLRDVQPLTGLLKVDAGVPAAVTATAGALAIWADAATLGGSAVLTTDEAAHVVTIDVPTEHTDAVVFRVLANGIEIFRVNDWGSVNMASNASLNCDGDLLLAAGGAQRVKVFNSDGTFCVGYQANVSGQGQVYSEPRSQPGLSCYVGRLIAGQAAPGLQIQDPAGNYLSGINKAGYATTRLNAAPADADLAGGEAAYWFDPTPGAAKFMVKAKDTNGTVVTGSIPLA